jgi:hypothetical protein
MQRFRRAPVDFFSLFSVRDVIIKHNIREKLVSSLIFFLLMHVQLLGTIRFSRNDRGKQTASVLLPSHDNPGSAKAPNDIRRCRRDMPCRGHSNKLIRLWRLLGIQPHLRQSLLGNAEQKGSEGLRQAP